MPLHTLTIIYAILAYKTCGKSNCIMFYLRISQICSDYCEVGITGIGEMTSIRSIEPIRLSVKKYSNEYHLLPPHALALRGSLPFALYGAF